MGAEETATRETFANLPTWAIAFWYFLIFVSVCVFAGYFFGNLPFVKANFSLVILAIIGISILPAVVEVVRHRLAARRAPAPAAPPLGE